MGVLNVTPDSFSDGGRYFEPGLAVERGLQLIEEGADILDIGGESTRPGALAGDSPAVTADEELRRVIPVIDGIRRQRPNATLSIDTYKSRTAREAVAHGAEIVNDISGLGWDPQMGETIAERGCGVVLMHTRGRPQDWRSLPPLGDVVGTVKRELSKIAERAARQDIARERIVLDPGFGFGKILEQNYPLLARFGELRELGYPLLAGVSRKGFVRKLTGATAPQDSAQQVPGSLAAAVICAMSGAHIIRAHDVAETRAALAVADLVLSENPVTQDAQKEAVTQRRGGERPIHD